MASRDLGVSLCGRLLPASLHDCAAGWADARPGQAGLWEADTSVRAPPDDSLSGEKEALGV